MKSRHRIRRRRTQREPSSIGAPFLGAFRVDVVAQILTNFSVVTAKYRQDGDNINVSFEAWNHPSVFPVDAFEVRINGNIVAATAAYTIDNGISIRVEHEGSTVQAEINAIAGHPALVSKQGWQCGGGHGFAAD